MVVQLFNSDQEELEDLFSYWLTESLKQFDILQKEWEDQAIIQSHSASQSRFQCNNCGVCCKFTRYWVWIYPQDLFQWLMQIEQDPRIPFLCCLLFPVTDSRGASGYAIPPQSYLFQKLKMFLHQNAEDPSKTAFFQHVLAALTWINPGFSPKSDFCTFYDPSNAYHCSIHNLRMIQCRTYPYDYSCFTQFQISPAHLAKYGNYDNQDPTRPLCPPEAFVPPGNFQQMATTEEERMWVLEEKVNYSLTIRNSFVSNVDISEILMEIFSEDIIKVNLQYLKANPKQIFTQIRFRQNLD